MPILRTDTENMAIYRWNVILGTPQGLLLFEQSTSGGFVPIRFCPPRRRVALTTSDRRPAAEANMCRARTCSGLGMPGVGLTACSGGLTSWRRRDNDSA